MERVRVAIVGAGPAGAFAAIELLGSGRNIEIDFFDRLPTPWGLLRLGVAPDHQDVKQLQVRFERETFDKGCRFFGNVEVGTVITHGELSQHYGAVFYATGAPADRFMGIPGEDLAGSRSAREFVAWYNGHPDLHGEDFDLSCERVVVVGNGNVALDVARMLMASPEVLSRTDMADHAVAALSRRRIRNVVVLARRGPSQAAFSTGALHEIAHAKGVETRVHGDVLELDPVSREWLAERASFTQRRNMALLRTLAAPPGASSDREIELRFLSSPVRIWGNGRVEGVDVRTNQIGLAEHGEPTAFPGSGPLEQIECGLVLRAVGYRGMPLPHLPFDERRGVLTNECGKVQTADGRDVPGTYVVGWAKRGPTGVLGSNKLDAKETVASFVGDLAGGLLPVPAQADRRHIDALLAKRGNEVVTAHGWRGIDAAEVAASGDGHRPRSKLTSYGSLLAAAGAVPHGLGGSARSRLPAARGRELGGLE